MRFKVNDVVKLRQKDLYWIQEGSRTLNATVDSTDDNSEKLVRAYVLATKSAPQWGGILILKVEGQSAPKDSVLAALCRSCDRA